MKFAEFDQYSEDMLMAQYDVSEIISCELMKGEIREDFLIADDLVVLCMRPDPEPLDAVRHIVSEGTISPAYANGPRFPDALEVKRWMPRVGLEKLEVLVGGLSNLWRQRVIQRPEAARIPSVSKRSAVARLMLRQRLLDEAIELSGRGVGLNLTVP
jgi:hypothetical protein